MRTHIAIVATLLAALFGRPEPASAVGTAFTYQGQVQLSGTPAAGACDLQFSLFDALSGGAQIGSTQTVNTVQLTGGVFSVPLDFGVSAFGGADRFLQLAARCPASSGAFISLSPRQAVTATPYALFSQNIADGAVTSAKLGSNAVGTTQMQDSAVTSAKIADSSITSGDVGFNFAASASKGGPASDVACSACVVSSELSPTGSTNGQVLTSNGAAVNWQSPAGFVLPVDQTTATASPAFQIHNTGTGDGVQGFSPIGAGVRGESASGTGVVGKTTDGHSAVYGYTTAGIHGVIGYNEGAGDGVRGESVSGSGVVGKTNTGHSAVFGYATAGTYGVIGYNEGAGEGVHGESVNGTGVVGRGTGANGVGVHGYSASRAGVFGESTNAEGVNGYTSSGIHGVLGQSDKSFNAGVIGPALPAGVRGRAAFGAGLVGESDNNFGVVGCSNRGCGLSYAFQPAGVVAAYRTGTFLGGLPIGHTAYLATATHAAVLNGDVQIAGGLIAGATEVKGQLMVTGKITADGGFRGSCASLPLPPLFCNQDLAESFASATATEAGDVVVLVAEPTELPTVRRSSTTYNELLVGVVSSNPGLLFDSGKTYLAGDNSNLITAEKTVVAVVGRVPVKFSTENGPVVVGDPLTSSTRPATAMRASRAGKIIGYALEPALANGTVLVWLQPGHYLPPRLMAKLNRLLADDE